MCRKRAETGTRQPDTAPIYHIRWLVVSEHARGRGVGRALIAEAQRRFVRAPATIEVVTCGVGHPAATPARAFYESLGFIPAEIAAPGPEAARARPSGEWSPCRRGCRVALVCRRAEGFRLS